MTGFPFVSQPDQLATEREIVNLIEAAIEDTTIPDAIVAYAKSKLPDYMIPSLWVEMEVLPITRNGKIDKKALPNPDASELLANVFVAPRNKTEEELSSIWSRLLGVEKVGVHDNFFELGGHSLLAMQLVSRLNAKFEIELPLKLLFESGDLQKLAKHIDELVQLRILENLTNEVDALEAELENLTEEELLAIIEKKRGA